MSNRFNSLISAAKRRQEKIKKLRKQPAGSRMRPDDIDSEPLGRGVSVVRDEDEQSRNKRAIDRVNEMIALVDKVPPVDSDVIIKQFPELYLNYNCIGFLRELVIEGRRKLGSLPSGMDLVQYQDILFDKSEIDELYMDDTMPPAKFLPDDLEVLVGMIDLVKWKREMEAAGKKPKLEDAQTMFTSAFSAGFGEGPGVMAEKAWRDPDMNLRPIIQSVRIAQAEDISPYRRMWATSGIHWWYTGQRNELIAMIKSATEASGKRM